MSFFVDAVSLLRATNITGSSLTFDDLVHVPEHYVSPEQILRSGDVVIASSSGSKDVVGKAGQVLVETDSVSFGAFCTAIRPTPEIHYRYLGYYFESPAYRGAVSDISAGSSINNIKSSELAAHAVPVAPAAEQARIVEKLEELLSDLDAGVAELKAAQRKLAQYRQSLLKAAAEGALTTDWRAANGKPRETGAELLQRILSERRARWEQKQLAKFAEQGKTPPGGWSSKYPEPVAPDLTGLPSLPAAWTWATLDQLSEFVTSGSRGWADYYANSGAAFIRSQNINRDLLDLSEIAYVDPPRNSEGARTLVGRDDLLLTITGANVGKCAIVDVDLEEAYVSQHVALIRLADRTLSRYLHLFLTSNAGGRGQLNKQAYGAGKPGLNLQQVLSVVVPVSEPEEMAEILDAVASTIEACTAQMDAIDHGLKQASALRKNTLKAAFAGLLVAQDPNDEPASGLLARIRVAREANGNGSKASKRGRKAKETA